MVKDFPQLPSRRPVTSNMPWTMCGPVIYIFWALQEHLAVKQLATDTTVKQLFIFWLKTFDTDIFYAGIKPLMSWWDRCLNVGREYMEV
jgi:hypothetical protein